MTLRNCPDCGELFDPSRGGKSGPRAKRCRPCQFAASRDRKAGTEAMRSAIKSGARNAVFVSPREVYTRDNWTCHICNEVIPEDLRVSKRIEVAGYNPLTPTLDHVTPCKLGGDHTLDNIKAAHHSCNARKNSNESPKQLATVNAVFEQVADEDRCAVDGCPRPRHIKQADGTYTGKNRNRMCRTHNRRVLGASGDPLKAQCGCGCRQLIAVDPQQSGRIFVAGHSANKARTPSAKVQLTDPNNFRVDPATGCKLWTKTLHRGGYGVVYLSGRAKSTLVHRAAYEIAHGEDSVKGLVVDHLCSTRACYNIDHLEAVTHTENIRRGAGKGRRD